MIRSLFSDAHSATHNSHNLQMHFAYGDLRIEYDMIRLRILLVLRTQIRFENYAKWF